MPKNQKNVRTKKYRRDRNHAEFLEAIELFNILRIPEKILGYAYPAGAAHEKRIAPFAATQFSFYSLKYAKTKPAFLPKDKNTHLKRVKNI